MGNNLPRATVIVQKHGRGYRHQLLQWVADHLGATDGTVLHPTIWRKGDRLVLDKDAVIYEVLGEESDG